MAIVRDPLLINPEAIPAQTAYDLANMIYTISSEELTQIFNEAKQEYDAPHASWVWSALYYVLSLRVRGQDFTEANSLIENREASSLTESVAFAPVKKIFDKEEGTWYEGSANTLLMKVLLRHLKGYDHDIKMSAQKLKELYDLLNICMNKRIELNHQLKEIESQLDKVCAEIADKEREYIGPHQYRINQIPNLSLEIEPGKRQEWIRKEKAHIREKQALLKPLRDQEDVLSIQRMKVMSKLVELNPSLNLSRRLLEEDNMYLEAAKVGKAAEEAAIREYIVRVKDQRARNKELTSLAAAAPKLTERKAMVKLEAALPGAAVNLGVSRAQEALAMCKKSTVVSDDLFKSRLTTLMQSLTQTKPLPEKQVVVIEQSQMMREKQSLLEAAGLFGAPAVASKKPEHSSFTPQGK